MAGGGKEDGKDLISWDHWNGDKEIEVDDTDNC